MCESIPIWSFPGPYSVRMRENMEQKNSEYKQFLHSGMLIKKKKSVVLIK